MKMIKKPYTQYEGHWVSYGFSVVVEEKFYFVEFLKFDKREGGFLEIKFIKPAKVMPWIGNSEPGRFGVTRLLATGSLKIINGDNRSLIKAVFEGKPEKI